MKSKNKLRFTRKETDQMTAKYTDEVLDKTFGKQKRYKQSWGAARILPRNSMGGAYAPARFKKCKKCFYNHAPKKTCITYYKKDSFLRSRSKEGLDKDLDRRFKKI
jgi:hypothetical protein